MLWNSGLCSLLKKKRETEKKKIKEKEKSGNFFLKVLIMDSKLNN